MRSVVACIQFIIKTIRNKSGIVIGQLMAQTGIAANCFELLLLKLFFQGSVETLRRPLRPIRSYFQSKYLVFCDTQALWRYHIDSSLKISISDCGHDFREQLIER